MNSNVRLFFNIVSNVIDKEKPYYIRDNNLIVLTGKEWYKYNYYLEAEPVDDKNLKHLYIILSNEKIDKCCRPLVHDNFGRTKIKIREFKDYFRSIYSKDNNITFSVSYNNDDYTAYLV